MSPSLTHLDENGRARMVDVGDKQVTVREAAARGVVRMAPETFTRAISGDTPKGDIRAVAEIAGVMAAKRTAELIPMCHPLLLSSIKVDVDPDDEANAVIVTARVRTTGQTGVEMEALTAASIACLTIYDMLKAIDREMSIEGLMVLSKSGGASGDYERSEP